MLHLCFRIFNLVYLGPAQDLHVRVPGAQQGPGQGREAQLPGGGAGGEGEAGEECQSAQCRYFGGIKLKI